MINLQKLIPLKFRHLLKNKNTLFDFKTEAEFEAVCFEIFHYQAKENKVYKRWLQALKVSPEAIKRVMDIPFLPISFFKNQAVVCGNTSVSDTVFTSSSTTSQIPSKHIVKDIKLYENSYLKCFEQFYGQADELVVLALLPNYLQRQGSSLVYMVNDLIQRTANKHSGFYLDDLVALKQKIESLKKTNQKVLLIGVTYALLDLCAMDIFLNENFIVMETGGMKGRRKEMIKEELHTVLKAGFKIQNIHSEYGMTELLSQAYSKGNGVFENPPWMRFLIRDIDDPFHLKLNGKTGGINVIDLANVESCSFIATQDLGKINEKNQLELMGRFDHSDVRGCNLMVSNI